MRVKPAERPPSLTQKQLTHNLSITRKAPVKRQAGSPSSDGFFIGCDLSTENMQARKSPLLAGYILFGEGSDKAPSDCIIV